MVKFTIKRKKYNRGGKMKIIRYINGKKIGNTMPKLCVDNPIIVRTVLKIREESLLGNKQIISHRC